MKLRFITVVALLISVTPVFPQELLVQPYPESAPGITFPRLMGGLRRGEVTDYEKKQKGLGIGIRYYDAENQIKADVYIYNLGLTAIPDGIESRELVGVFEQARREVHDMEKSGSYQSVKKLSEDVASFGHFASAPRALRAYFSFTQDGTDRFSHIYLTAYKNLFLKIRFTYPKEQKANSEKFLAEFLEEMGKLLVNEDKLRSLTAF